MHDYIIVGAGSSGSALAARLSEDPATTVLLLEAGPDYRAADAPRAMRLLNPFHILDASAHGAYQYETLLARRSSAQEPRLYWRGRGLGGSSAINGVIAVRGMPEDFDAWADQGCVGWSWADVLPAFIRLEDDLDFGDEPYHGRGGPIPIYRTPRNQWGAVDRALCEAAIGLGYGWHDDHNAPGSHGVSPYAINGRGARRVSTNDAYLEPARDRPNLTILGDAVVDRVCFAGRQATGVRAITADGVREFPARQVILSAGAVHSPAILLRSGIGPAGEVRALGVGLVADLPVGQGLVDHSSIWLGLRLEPQSRVPTLEHRHTNCCVRYSSGLAGAGVNDMFMASMNVTGPDEAGREQGLIVVATFQTFSRGWVRLDSLDPLAQPEVEINMLSDDRDLVRLRDGYKRLLQIARHPAMEAISDGLVSCVSGEAPIGDAPDNALDAWLLANCTDTQHPVGTCRMGDPRSLDVVVHPDCRVVGCEGLSVVDASIMPEIVRANTHLTAVMIGELVAARHRAGGRPEPA